MVLGTIETWAGVWQETGVLPSGCRSPKARVSRWGLSDAGGYAALIQAIALWLMYRGGTNDWELIRAQAPAAPLASHPLTPGVIAAQGL